MMHKTLTLTIIILFLVPFASASSIYGTVYDISFKKAINAKVEINTTPKQITIAQNGSYSFSVPEGTYILSAKLLQMGSTVSYTQENLSVSKDGSYILDLVLFPDIEEGLEKLDLEINDNLLDTKTGKTLQSTFPYLIVITCIILIAVLWMLFHSIKLKSNTKNAEVEIKSQEPQSSKPIGLKSDLDKLVEIIHKEGGRTTQKEIRKAFPLSEAKISLMITELEHKGIIEKIKKGRGNILVLKK